jgi:hypothetical protein
LLFALGIGPLVQASLTHSRRFLPDWRLAAAPIQR